MILEINFKYLRIPFSLPQVQTLLQPSASEESAFFWLLQARIPRREPPSAAGLLQTHKTLPTNKPCEICGKTFKYEEIKQKHTAIAHENVKIYCHYFNNRNEFPFLKIVYFSMRFLHHVDIELCV